MPVDASRTERSFEVDWRRCAALVVLTGLFFALTSPFNAVTYLPFAARWLYWAALIALFLGTHLTVWRLAGPDRARWQRVLLVSVLATPLVLVTILTVQQAIDRPVPTDAWPSLAASIWVINAALAFLAASLLHPAPKDADDTAASEPHTSRPPADSLRQRLPLHARDTAIWALGAQDHYVDVIQPEGHHLVHMRLGDAVALLGDQDGLKVHRSWWVARDAVADIARHGRRLEIRLRNGQTVPVSRAGAAELKNAGWLH
ncbi:MAG: LytTR family DNA-binding domain-containing protein [Pseudomonadota bacterium]